MQKIIHLLIPIKMYLQRDYNRLLRKKDAKTDTELIFKSPIW